MDDLNQYLEIRRAIEQRQFIDWHGLPRLAGLDGLPARQVFPELPSSGGMRPVRHLGSEFRPVRFYVVDIPGYHRLTLNLDGEQLVLVDGMLPELAEGVAPLKHAFGDPAACLDWWYGTLDIPGGEWVYPQRGITLFLNFNRDRALHLAVYAPVELRAYEERLRPHLRAILHDRM